MISLSLLSARAGAATTNCVALEVRTADGGGGGSSLVRLDLDTGSSVPVTQLGGEINAIGYAPQQNLVYGIATGHGGHLVRISTQGSLSDLGQVRGAGGRLGDAVAGAVLGGDLYVRADGWLIAVGVDPSNGDFGAVARQVPVHPQWLADDVDDFAVDTSNGLLYGLQGDSVVSIDPGSGAVRVVTQVRGLPGWASFGSVVLSGQSMYAIADDVFGQSRLYRIPLDGTGPAIQLASWSAADVTDMAGCLVTAAPPTSPPPPPPVTTHRPPPPPPTTPPPSTTPKPVPAQVIPPTTTVPPTTTTVPAPSPTPPPPVPTSAAVALPQARLLAQPSDTERSTQRRWALTTVVLIFGGSAAAARTARARARKPR